VPTLTELVNTYIGTSDRVNVENTDVQVIVDGVDFFASIAQELGKCTGQGDFVYVMGWVMDCQTPLQTPAPAGGPNSVGDWLAALNTAQVDVRVLLWGSDGVTATLPEPVANGLALKWLRDHGVKDVALDCGGSWMSSRHTKAVIVGAGQSAASGTLTAYLSGMDFGTNRIDDPSHKAILPNPQNGVHCAASGARWHDAGARLSGAAARDVLADFMARWNACAVEGNTNALDIPTDLHASDPGATRAVIDGWNYDEYTHLPSPMTQMDMTSISTTNASVVGGGGIATRVLRSEGADKMDSWRKVRPAIPDIPASGPLTELQATLTNAFTSAQKYIYVEDQSIHTWSTTWMLRGSEHTLMYPLLVDAMRRGVKVVLVSRPDGADKIQETQSLAHDLNLIVADLNRHEPATLDNFAVYKPYCITVHSKLVIVDDVFMTIGSGNFFDSSWTGLDSECSVAIVSDTTSNLVRDLRVRLWSEHVAQLPAIIGTDPTEVNWNSAVARELQDVDHALGIWRSQWRTPGTTGQSVNFSFEPASPSPPDGPPGPRLQIIYPEVY